MRIDQAGSRGAAVQVDHLRARSDVRLHDVRGSDRQDLSAGNRHGLRNRIAGVDREDRAVGEDEIGGGGRLSGRSSGNVNAISATDRENNFFPVALGPHPQRELTLTPRLGFARPRLGVAAGAPDAWRMQNPQWDDTLSARRRAPAAMRAEDM